MKIRKGFVSNSSSASFMIHTDDVSPNQLKAFIAYNESKENTDGWEIEVNEDNYVCGSTHMDNCVIGDFLEKIGLYNKVEVNDES